MKPSPGDCIAVFISPHGLGHASRAGAVMEALLALKPDLRFLVFGRTPAWVLDPLPSGSFEIIPCDTDVGMVQVSPLQEDLPASLAALQHFCAGLEAAAGTAGRVLSGHSARLALCDISPLGILAARQAGIPSALVENFTWDWIYEQYGEIDPAFLPFARTFAAWYSQASLHIQTEPVCRRDNRLPGYPPASRKARLPAGEARCQMGLDEGKPLALVSLGSLLQVFPVLQAAARRLDWNFLIPDAAPQLEIRGNLVLLPQHYTIGHPDLAAASDVLIAKSGYSTIAEAYACGIPYGYLNRPLFPESAPLEAFLKKEMPALEIPREEMASGAWTSRLDELAELPRRPHLSGNGAQEIARAILQLLA